PREGPRRVRVPRPPADRGCAMTTTQPAVLLEHYLKRLKLPTILREYARLATVCTQDRSDYATYLLRLVEREVIDREHRAAERRGKAGGLPGVKGLGTVDLPAPPAGHEGLGRGLIRGAFIPEPGEALVRGGPGARQEPRA